MDLRFALLLLAVVCRCDCWFQQASCDVTFTDTEGVIESPNYPRYYPNGRVCIYYIEADPQDTVTVWCDRFYLRGGGCDDKCSSDYLLVSGCGHQEKYCGNEGPEVTIQGSTLLVFRSDRRRNGPGFSCSYKIDSGYYTPPVVTPAPHPSLPIIYDNSPKPFYHLWTAAQIEAFCRGDGQFGYFVCKNGEIIPVDGLQHQNPRCDGVPQCSDDSDESSCNEAQVDYFAPCLCDRFLCYTGECIPDIWRCDSVDDCHMGDEDDCANVSYLAKSNAKLQRILAMKKYNESKQNSTAAATTEVANTGGDQNMTSTGMEDQGYDVARTGRNVRYFKQNRD